jgi:hypothetical protein
MLSIRRRDRVEYDTSRVESTSLEALVDEIARPARPSRIGHREITRPPDDRQEKVVSAAAAGHSQSIARTEAPFGIHFLVRRRENRNSDHFAVAMASLSIWAEGVPISMSG